MTSSLLPNSPASLQQLGSDISRKWQDIILPMSERMRRGEEVSNFAELDHFLNYLDEDVVMIPALRLESHIDAAFHKLIRRNLPFPPVLVTKARELERKWTDAPANIHPAVLPTPVSPIAPAEPVGVPMLAPNRLPHLLHPIYGVQGIMHGFGMSQGQRRHYFRDRRYNPRAANVFGHNNLAVGTWWPLQRVAVFNGGHGRNQAGIAFNPDGAYSIVITSEYRERDIDHGDMVYYSAVRGSSQQPSTEAMDISFQRNNPIRLLRAASARTEYSPAVGYRYDGLYHIVGKREIADETGSYWQFQLARLDDQTPLMEVMRTSPTARQRHDYERIRDGY